MVTYYLGNVRNKRKLLRTDSSAVAYADNSDVLADFMLGGKVCFVLGDIPFGDMRLGEYLAYSRALRSVAPLSAKEAKLLIKRAGLNLPLEKKMARLTRLEYRFVALAAVLSDETEEVRINLDGVAYSRIARAKMRAYISRLVKLYDVRVSVSDCRFASKNARTVVVTADGSMREGRTQTRSKRYARMKFGKDKIKESLALSSLSGRKTLLCDN